MDLHLHLSVAFRALDRKWGPSVDLETTETSLPCLPATIDRPTTTFSSEDFLKKRHRPKPYSRIEELKRRRVNLKRNDSFGNISSTRIPSMDDVYNSVDSGLDDCTSRTVTSYVQEFQHGELRKATSIGDCQGHKELRNAPSVEDFPKFATGKKTKEEFRKGGFGSTASLDSGLEDKMPVKKIFGQLKSSAKLFIEKKCKKIRC